MFAADYNFRPYLLFLQILFFNFQHASGWMSYRLFNIPSTQFQR